MGFGTKQARDAKQADLEAVARSVEAIEADSDQSSGSVSAPVRDQAKTQASPPAARPNAASFFVRREAGGQAAVNRPSSAPVPGATRPSPPVSGGRPTAFGRPTPTPTPAAASARPRAFGGNQPAPNTSSAPAAGGFRAPVSAPSQPAASVPMPAPRSLQQMRLERLIEEVAKVRGVKASAVQEMIKRANAQPEAARTAFEKAYREEVLPLRENMVRDMASARSQNPDAVVFLLSDPQNKKSRVIVLDQDTAQEKGLNLLDNATLVCQVADYTPFDRPAAVFGEGRGLSDDATQQEARRPPRP